MVSIKRATIVIAGFAVWLLVFGFVMFSTAAMREEGRSSSAAQAQGIVVLTGGQTRIAEAARLLSEGRGERLLISGVNAQTKRESLRKISGLDEETFNCCVDLGYAALDTVGNAAETRRWAEARHYDSLVVVTASYHMPRSIAELTREMPGVRLIPHPVVPADLRRTRWWLDSNATRLLLSEYLKYLPAAARLVAERGVTPWHSSSLAAASTDVRSKS